MPTVQDVMTAMESIAPARFAEPGDRERIGLHSGNPDAPVSRVLLALDASLSLLQQAAKAAEMLVVHHPRFYTPIRNVTDADPSGRRARVMVKHDLAVFSAHTNLDVIPGGTNDALAVLTGLQEARILVPTFTERLLKLAVFVPDANVEHVMRALDVAGAGAIGGYSACTFRSAGVGSYRCGAGTNPFHGRPGEYVEAEECRLETVFPEGITERVVNAMLEAHVYEEVAYDLYPLLGREREYGLGRVGELAKAETVGALAARLAKATGSGQTQFSGRLARRVRRIAVWAGAGAPAEAVIASGAEVVVTGEMGYHETEIFMDNNVSVITLGHGYSEEPVLSGLAAALRERVPGVTFSEARRGDFVMWNV